MSSRWLVGAALALAGCTSDPGGDTPSQGSSSSSGGASSSAVASSHATPSGTSSGRAVSGGSGSSRGSATSRTTSSSGVSGAASSVGASSGLALPTIVSFQADPTSLTVAGGQVALSWQVENATALTLNGVPVPGTLRMERAVRTRQFTLTASNAAGSVQRELTVTVAPLPAMYALSEGGALLELDAENPSVALRSVPITGVAVGEQLRALDTRPGTGQLYALAHVSTQSVRLYTVDPATGVATAVTAAPVTGEVDWPLSDMPDMEFESATTIRVIDGVTNYRLSADTGEMGLNRFGRPGQDARIMGSSTVAAAATDEIPGQPGRVYTLSWVATFSLLAFPSHGELHQTLPLFSDGQEVHLPGSPGLEGHVSMDIPQGVMATLDPSDGEGVVVMALNLSGQPGLYLLDLALPVSDLVFLGALPSSDPILDFTFVRTAP